MPKTDLSPHLHISASFVAEPLRPALEFWLKTLGLPQDVSFADYAQVLQEALDPTSQSATNGAGGVNVFLLRACDMAVETTELVAALSGLATRSQAATLVLLCPESAEASASAETGSTEGLQGLQSALSGVANLTCLPAEEMTRLYALDEIFDPEAEASGHVPYTEAAYTALATLIARQLDLRSRAPKKVLALDADNTLWGGVCGEDGAEGVDLGEPYRSLRAFAKEKYESGILLALVSKNQESDVDAVFASRAAELGLARDDFSDWKANWNPKSQSLHELAAELNVGLDSFVFLDDNPVETAEVRAHCPGVLALTLPSEADEIPGFLQHIWALDTLPMTAEDAVRANFYRDEKKRKDLRSSAPSFGEFLRGLDLQIDIAEAKAEDLLRVSQLTKRTNQFNANPLRLSEAELTAALDAGATCLTVRVQDRFGDYGLVGAALYGAVADETLPVELFLLSCRAMGKGVERAMVAALGQRAREAGAKSLAVAFSKTDRNEPCRRFFEGLGGLVLDAEKMAELPAISDETNEPTAASRAESSSDSATSEKTDASTARAGSADSDLALRIATELRSPEQIRALLTQEKKARPDISPSFVAPGTETQTRLAAIWADILGLEKVGVEDPFTALGGSSLQLVRLHAVLRREFGANLELVDLFELPTIARLADRLDKGESTNAAESAISALPSARSGEDVAHPDEDAVAVIGLALKVPGASNPDTFWHNLINGVESISQFEQNEIAYPEEYGKPGYVPAKGIVDGVDLFDASFFGILPREAKIMDPQQRLFLELAWEAMERGGYATKDLKQRVGVYAGAYFDTYLLANLCTDTEFLSKLIPQIQVGTLQAELGNDKDYLATRVAFKLNLRGPAINLQSACSTSLVAIVEACRAIRSGLCDMALAGGVTLTLPLKRGYFYTEQGMLSGDGHCRAFDKDASGTVFGNGAGVVLLKRLSDAVADRDHIYAVIRGTGLNNDGGVKHSYTAPSVEGQCEVIRMAHQDAGITADSIGYIEAHGTATPLGDPIEIAALTKAFRATIPANEAGETDASDKQFCAVGSAKTNIGHLDVASGVCGVIKTALSLEKEMLPPILHFKEPNPKIDFANSPFYVNAKLSPWKEGRKGQPRRAGVSGFGVGGTNAHVVLEEAPVVHSEASHRRQQLFLLSARSESALETSVARLADFAQNHPNSDLADVAWTLAKGRTAFRHRRAVVASDHAALIAALQKPAKLHGAADKSRPRVNFLFPGQGTQHLGMCRDFYDNEPRFRATLDHCAEVLCPSLGFDLIEAIFPPEGADREAFAHRLERTHLAQPAIFSIEYALADLWRHWGPAPAAMVGHSVGEFVAACVAGVFSLEDGLRLLAARGHIMEDMPGGGMLSVRLSEEEVLRRLPESLDLAAVNAPQLCVVSGPHEELSAFQAALEAEDIPARPLHTSHAFHSRMMDEAVTRFAEEVGKIALHAPAIPILSIVTGKWLTEAETTNPLYWAKHLRETVRFQRSVRLLGEEQEGQIFLEVGPGSTLAGLARQSLGRTGGHVSYSTCLHVKEEGDDHACALGTLGALWSAGGEVDWDGFYADEIRKRVPLPTYPFERKSFWIDPKPLAGQSAVPPQITAAPLVTATAAEASAPSISEISPSVSLSMSTPEAINRRPNIVEAIQTVLSNLSDIPATELPEDATYLEIGFDSLLLTQASKALGDAFGVALTLRDLMGNVGNIGALADQLDATLPADKYRPALQEAPAVPVTPVVAAAPVAVAATAPAPAPQVAVAVPAMAVAPVPNVAFSAPLGDNPMERILSQQLDLMRQQISLLQGVPATAIPAATPVAASNAPSASATPAASPTPAPAPTTAPAQKAPALSLSSSSDSGDTSAPTTAIHRSVDGDLTEQQKRHLSDLIARYTAKTHTSKELTARYRQWYADPRTVSGFHLEWKDMVYQIAVKQSKGSRLLDVDGNEYIDLLNGFGPNFLGHSPDFVTAALKAQLDHGIEVGPQCQTAMEAAQLFCEVTGNERVSFVNTGSEAVQAAIRLARTVTGRDKIVTFSKDYHGNFDEVLVRSVGSGDKLRTLPIAPGIPRRAVEDMIVLPYGSDEALEIIRSRAHELAAVIIEPIQSRKPEFQPVEFVREVRKITRESGALFVFDEVITGFRTGPHGAEDFYGIDADIATYGKVVAGGMPIGVVAGKAEYMDTFDGGMWQYGDDSFPEKGVTFFAGTFVRHPLAMAAVKAVLLHLKAQGPEYWQSVKAKADRLAGNVDRMFVETGAPFRMPNFGSQMFLRAAADHKYANLLFFHLRTKGVFLLEGFPSYMTAAHTEDEIDYCIAAFRESVGELQEGGFFTPAPSGTVRLGDTRLQGPARKLIDLDSVTTESTHHNEQTHADASSPAHLVSPISSSPISSSPISSSPISSSPISTTVGVGENLHPLSESQAEVWLASQLSKEASLCFNEINLISLRGALDTDALRRSLQNLLDRHEALRATYEEDGSGYRIQPSCAIDLTLLDEGDEKETLTREQETPFDLVNGPLLRATLLRRAEEDHLLILNAHHLACDGWSYLVILDELSQLYTAEVAGTPHGLAEAPRFVGSHIEDADEVEKATTWWREQYASPVSPLNLPTDYPPLAEADFHCGTIATQLDAATLRDLKRTAGKSGATLFGLLLSAYQIFLHRLSGQSRFVIAFPSAAQSRHGQEGRVGHSVNFLVCPLDYDATRTLPQHLKITLGKILDSLDHSVCTYGHLLKALPLDQRPTIEAVFNFERMDSDIALGTLQGQVWEAERRYTSNPLFLKACEGKNGLEIRFDFHSSRFSTESVSDWLATYRAILEEMLAHPDATVDSVSAAMSKDQRDRLAAWNETKVPFPYDSSISQLFDEVAQLHPDAIAIRDGDSTMSYAELSRLVDKLAHSYTQAGAAADTKVAFLLHRTPLQIATVYAIMKCGAICVPIDPEYPLERMHLILEDSQAAFIITEGELASGLPKDLPIVEVEKAARRGKQKQAPTGDNTHAEDAAVVLYTSGSTGKPKGVLNTHCSIVRLVKNSRFCHFGEGETILNASSICFDASLLEIHGALLNGGTLSLPPAGKLSLEDISETIIAHQVTTLWLTAGLFQIMVDEALDAFQNVRQVISGGDIMSPKHAAKLLDTYPDILLTNGYGPTENTTFTTCHPVKAEDFQRRSIPVGKPISNTTVHILDESRRQVAPGIPGELWTGGDGLALGYLGMPEVTAEKFIPDPFGYAPGSRLYRTGDRCRFLSDGIIEFLGRIDQQVKIRGFRVEPGEIEAVLAQHPYVGQCRVAPVGESAVGKTLAAYVTPSEGVQPSSQELLSYLRSKLPDYLVPSSLMVMDRLPLNTNGKIDGHHLPHNHSASLSDSQEANALSPTETTLQKLWTELLKIPHISPHDDFFTLGGHSLLGMKLFARIQRAFDITLPLSALFRAPTIQQLAILIDERIADKTGSNGHEVEHAYTHSHKTGGIHLLAASRHTPSVSKDALSETTVAIQAKGDLPPLFAVHGGDGGILFYGSLAQRLNKNRPFYAFEAPALTATSPIPNEPVEETAANYLADLREIQPYGPYHLCGYSFGGLVAYEMACQLLDAGEEVDFLGLLDTENPAIDARKLSLSERISVNWNKRSLADKSVFQKVSHLGKRISSGLAYRLYFEAEDAIARTLPQAKGAGWLRQVQLRKAHERAMDAYIPRPYAGRMALFRAMVGGDKFDVGDDYGWNDLVDELEIIDVPGNHISLFHKENVEFIAAAIRKELAAAPAAPLV